MASNCRLGHVNAALISLYFAPVWGTDAVRALMSPYYGFDDRMHAVAAGYFCAVFDLGLEGLLRTSNVLAGIKLIAAAALLAYLIEFARALVVGREPDRQTLDAALVLAGSMIMLCAWPALAAGDEGLIRVQATQFLLLCGAMVVLTVERCPVGAVNPLRSDRAQEQSASRERRGGWRNPLRYCALHACGFIWRAEIRALCR